MEPRSDTTPVKLAFCIGAYRLCDFVHLNLKQLQRLAPGSPILVSDDTAPESGHIENIANAHGASYLGARARRGHFSADLQSFVNALAFAEAVGADVAVKVSQRFIFRKPESIAAITESFEDPNILVVSPGQPKVGAVSFNGKPSGFGAFTCLSDIVAIRVGCVSPAELIHMYRDKLLRQKFAHDSFLECLIDDFHTNRFPGRTVKLEAITNHQSIEDPSYLRRYQNHDGQYQALAATHGLSGGKYPCGEWQQIEGRSYLCRPLVV